MDDANPTGYGTSQLPLAGAILCCTAIPPEQRTELAAIAAQMGATIKLDLTSDVTHLIVGSTHSAKYRYVAKSRDDVKVLSPAWLQALREAWVQADDTVDLAALERDYRLPTLVGLKICLTGFDDLDQRRSIQEIVDSNGAEYQGDLTKSVTHLIAAAPSGKKYEHALNWDIKIVSLEWLDQSIERGMILDEALYNPSVPAVERGQGAWDRKQLPSPTLGKRTRDAEQTQSLNPFRRKLRRSASTKMGSQSEALWAGITAASLERQHDDGDEWIDDSVAKQGTPRVQSPAARIGEAHAREEYASVSADAADGRGLSVLPLVDGTSRDGIFQGRIVVTHGFDAEQTHILRKHLDSHGARVVGADELDNISLDDLRQGYLVVPHDAEVDITALPDRAGSALNLVTNWWVERCLFGKRLVDPAENVLCRPFDKLSIGGFSSLTLHSTGFCGIELLQVTKVVTLMGAIYDELLSTKSSAMICNSMNPDAQKLKYVTDKRIPAVHATWLWECLRTGSLQPFSKYQLNTLGPAQPQRPKLKPSSPTDLPTARLSEKDSVKVRQRIAQVVKVEKYPQRLQRPRTLDLATSVEAAPTSTTDSLALSCTKTKNLGFGQDEPAMIEFDGQASFPLQDISVNSPRRHSTSSLDLKPTSRPRSSSTESLIRAVPTLDHRPRGEDVTSDSVLLTNTEPVIPVQQEVPKEPEEKDYSIILAQLRANRKAAPTPADQADEKRRKRSQLGRAASTRSNQSTADSSGNIGLDADDDEPTRLIEQYQPSQELGWDSPGAAKAREQMIKKLGCTINERSVPVKGIGIVKDVVSESAGRAGRKRRV